MAGVNKVILIGNLGQDPEMRETQGGTKVANMSIATSRKWRNKDGGEEEDTQWHRVQVWGRQAESCCKYLAKGRQAYVEGRLQTRKWEDKDGVTRWTTEVVAQQVQFLGGKGSGGGGNNPPPADEPPPGMDVDDDIPF